MEKATCCFIKPTGKEARVQLVKTLERDGFTMKSRDAESADVVNDLDRYGYHIGGGTTLTKQEVLGSVFPIVVNTTDMEYDLLNSITCAAAASGQGLLISEDEFYDLYYGSDRREV